VAVRAAPLAARCLDLLGPVAGPVVIVAPCAPALRAALATRAPAPDADGAPVAAVVAFLGVPARPDERQHMLRDLQRRLPAGARFVLVDHNQPRVWWRRALALPGLAGAGLGPARARYPAARELAALGFTVERLRLGHGERVQFIVARR
jgi:hypothetical protein